MSLVLIDTSQETDVCYNDTLVHEGYAIFKPDDHTTNLTGPTDAPEVSKRDVPCPVFKQLLEGYDLCKPFKSQIKVKFVRVMSLVRMHTCVESNLSMYSQTCIKWSPWRKKKNGSVRQLPVYLKSVLVTNYLCITVTGR